MSNNPYTSPFDPQTAGTSADIQARVLYLIPRRWWQWQAIVQGWIIGGLSDAASLAFGWFTYVLQQSRIATSTGPFLDLIAFDFLGRFLLRQGTSDTVFRTVITSTILQERVTRKGMIQVLTNLLGIAPTIIEPWNPGDCGGYSGKNQIVGFGGYGKVGAWGSLDLPGQFFIRVSRSGLGPAGVPLATGYAGYAGGYYGPGATAPGAIEYVGSEIAQIGITDDIIDNVIVHTKPSGTIAWVNID